MGYHYTTDNCYDFDIEVVEANGQNFTEAFEILDSDDDSRLVDLIKEATMAHMGYLFSSDAVSHDEETDIDRHIQLPSDAELLEARRKVEQGDFSSDNLFKAIGSICREYNNSIKQA